MAIVRLGPDGEVDVVEPPTAEEIAAGQAALIRIVEALARLDERRDYEAGRAERLSRPSA